MKKLSFLLSSCLFFCWQCTSSTHGKKVGIAKNCEYKVFSYLGKIPEASEKFITKNNIDPFFGIGEVNIDPHKKFKVDETHFRNYIRKHIPNKNATGFGVLDWETPFPILSNDDIQSESFKSAEREFIKAHKIAKEERPNIKWGYYALPFRSYWDRGDSWKNKNKKLENILAATDVIYPSVYDFYPDSTPTAGKKRDSLYVNDNVEEALVYGKKLNKPVLPFFWHRWHGKEEYGGMQSIPWKEFGPHIQAALNVTTDNEKIAGLVWWGADHFFHGVKKKPLLEETKNYKDFETYQNKIIIENLTNILNLTNNHCRNQN